MHSLPFDAWQNGYWYNRTSHLLALSIFHVIITSIVTLVLLLRNLSPFQWSSDLFLILYLIWEWTFDFFVRWESFKTLTPFQDRDTPSTNLHCILGWILYPLPRNAFDIEPIAKDRNRLLTDVVHGSIILILSFIQLCPLFERSSWPTSVQWWCLWCTFYSFLHVIAHYCTHQWNPVDDRSNLSIVVI